MTTKHHPAHGPVSLDRLHQIREHLQHDNQYSNGGNRAYILADILKVIDGAIAAFGAEPVLYAAEETLAYAKMGELHLKCLSQPMGDAVIPLYTAPRAPVSVPDAISTRQAIAKMESHEPCDSINVAYKFGWNACRAAQLQGAERRNQVRADHAEWSQTTFGKVGPLGPLKHLAKEAMEAAAAPGDLSEWADMQFLLWDAQRRADISDEQITLAMVEKLAVNKQRQWPEPLDGGPRLHIKADQQQEDK